MGEVAKAVVRWLSRLSCIPDQILDAAAGHGLVGMLLAHCLVNTNVLAVDLEERKLTQVALDAWAECGRPLENFHFCCGDLRQEGARCLEASKKHVGDSHALVVAVHACNEAGLDVLEVAKTAGSAWAVVPCCMRRQLYFPGSTHLHQDEHYPVMCGALANAQR